MVEFFDILRPKIKYENHEKKYCLFVIFVFLKYFFRWTATAEQRLSVFKGEITFRQSLFGMAMPVVPPP